MTVSFVNDLSIDVIAFRLILAILFGGIVGYEREKIIDQQDLELIF